jgi:hypothetical protein
MIAIQKSCVPTPTCKVLSSKSGVLKFGFWGSGLVTQDSKHNTKTTHETGNMKQNCMQDVKYVSIPICKVLSSKSRMTSPESQILGFGVPDSWLRTTHKTRHNTIQNTTQHMKQEIQNNIA